MSLTSQSGSKDKPEKVDWADPGYFSGTSVVGNTVRVLVQLVRAPRGHRTIPTKTGTMLILITIGVGTAAFNTGQNILYLALSLLMSTLLVSGILSWMNFKGCRWRLRTGRHFRVGDISPVYLELENTKRRLPSYDLTFNLYAEKDGQTGSLYLNDRLDPGATSRLQWDFSPKRRGRETICLQGLISRYPFGFLKKSIRDSFKKDVVVWPARIHYQFSGDKAGRRWMFGHHRRKGDGVELIHLRNYRHGDSLRRIHWKASARLGTLQVRETEQEHHQAFSLLVDPSPKVWKDARQFEKMCAFVASLAEDLFQRDQLRAVQLAGQPRSVIGGIDDLHAFLDKVALLDEPGNEKEPETRMDSAADTVRFLPGPDGSVIARMEDSHVGQA